MTYTLTLPGRLEGANKLNAMHWRSRAKHMKKIAQTVCMAARATISPDPPLRYTLIGIVSHRKRLLDPDNLVAGCKAYIDALMPPKVTILKSGVIRSKAGINWIQDDNSSLVTLAVTQVQSAHEFIVITLTPTESPHG